MKLCSKCLNFFPNDYVFCPMCGITLEEQYICFRCEDFIKEAAEDIFNTLLSDGHKEYLCEYDNSLEHYFTLGTAIRDYHVFPYLATQKCVNLEQDADDLTCAIINELISMAKLEIGVKEYDLGYYYSIGLGVKKNNEKALEQYKKAAVKGLVKAQSRIGDWYYRGDCVEQDCYEAFNWYLLAAVQGDAYSKYRLGYMYYHGEGVKRDFNEALKWFMEAAEQDYSYSQYWVGKMYDYGEGVEEDKAEALKWYIKAAEQRNDEALFRIGEMYYFGVGVKVDQKVAEQYLRKAYASNSYNQAAKRLLVSLYFEQFDSLRNNANNGYVDAQLTLGFMYKEGIGVSKRLKTAFNWYMSAAQQGNVEGEYNVGCMFKEGSGVKEDKAEAFQWLEKAAQQGHDAAQYEIAEMYYRGKGVEANRYEAFEWYRKSAEAGYYNARFALDFSFGITKDSTEEEIAKVRESLLKEFENRIITEKLETESCDNDIITVPKEKSDREFILDYMNSANELSLPDEDNESLLRHYEEELIGIESENITDEKIEYEMSMSNEVNVNDSVGIYLKEISRIPFLHRSDELELAKRIDKRKQVTEFQEYCYNNETANIQNEIKTKEDFEESFNSLSKLLNSEYSVTDMRSLPVAFRKFDTKRRANQQYTVKNFIEDTIMFTKNDRKRFLGLLEEEKVNCTGWETKCPIRKSNYAPEIIDLVTISNGIKRLEDWVNNYYNNVINYSKNNQYDIQKDADNLIKLKIRFKNLLKEIGRQGEEANQQLLEANLKLVVYVAEWYVNRGMSFLDLIQEGNLGLIKALEKYDYTKGYRFRTHAIWWIRHAITRAIENKVRLIHIPANMIEKIKKMNQMNELLLRELGREPTPRETAELMETTESKIRRIMRIAQKPISVETIVSEAEGLQPGDIIEDYEMMSPADFASYRLMHAKVKDVLGTLSDKEREILELRYGLKDGRQRTLEEVGKHFGVTRERIRQIERQAFEKLRSSGAELIKYINT